MDGFLTFGSLVAASRRSLLGSGEGDGDEEPERRGEETERGKRSGRLSVEEKRVILRV